MVLPYQRSVRGRVRSVRGPAFLAPRQPADPNSDSSWLFVVALWSSICVVRHAESLARRLGEPYGTLLLTLTITSIEVVAISAVVRHGGPNPTLMRDTLLAVIMIIMNGMVGVTLLIGGVKHREQTFNLQGANAYLGVLLPLATFAMIMPDYTQTTPGPLYSVPQQVVLVIVSIALYLLFLVLQTGRYHDYFEDAGHPLLEAHQDDAPVWFSIVMLAAYMAAVVYPSSNSGRRSTTCSKLCRRRRRSGASSLRSWSRRPSRSAR
jgi:Ca2+:H+ antiporter